ncbi:MAG: Ig-like domain-containing protein, partial [Bacilli bacterium]|nr:Ig-like domain-containing protein [Bacilli bacterium]
MVIRKKISLFLLLFFISIVAIGCSGIDLKINGIDDLEVGESFQLTILDPEEEINDISWSSSDIKIATVDDSGIVMGIGEGTATITATAKNALGSVTVTVIPQRTLKIIAPDNLQIGSS